ncbi:MAG: laccase [Nocardioides sp.]|nr:laccase [Nocardioides sp.]
MFHFRTRLGPVELAFTDRHAGDVTFDPHDPTRVAVHRRLASSFGPGDAVAALAQVHGREVAYVGPEGPRATDDGPIHARADALVTDQPGVTLLVRAADCTPVVLADPEARVVGAAHAGRRGMAAGVVPALLEAMRDLGARGVRAWVGPRVCGGCYEVPEEMREEVAAAAPASRATTTWGTPSIDVGAGVLAQLAELGVPATDTGGCTVEDLDLFSYRREGPGGGRLAGLVRMDP